MAQSALTDPRPQLPTEDQLRFLKRVSLGDTVYEACEYCEIDRLVVNDWLKDKTFKIRYTLAQEDSADLLEKEARRRALQGVEKGVYYKGERVDSEQQYSDALMQFLLKGRRREVFGERLDIDADIRHTSIVAVLRALPMLRPAIEGQAKQLEETPAE